MLWPTLLFLDPATVIDKATFTSPHQFCEGVMHVFVNGNPVIDGTIDSGIPAGQVLRGPGVSQSALGGA